MSRESCARQHVDLDCIHMPVNEQMEIAKQIRLRSFYIVDKADSGHLGGPSSSSELLTALYFGGFLRIELNKNAAPERDRVLIRGHLAPLRYALFSYIGWVREEELDSYRSFGSRLFGHEKMGTVSGIDITPSGSLGMVLSYGVGAAHTAKVYGLGYRTFVFIGDGEEQEGNISEAARHGAALRLDNLYAIIDVNGKQLGRPTNTVDIAELHKLWEGYGWQVFRIRDGHSLKEINSVDDDMLTSDCAGPKVAIARTIKGRNLPGAEDHCSGYHTIHSIGRNVLSEYLNQAALESQNVAPREYAKECSVKKLSRSRVCQPEDFLFHPTEMGHNLELDLEKLFIMCGRKMGKGLPIYVMSADIMGLDQAMQYGFHESNRYIDVGIREQHLFALAHSLSICDPQARIVIKSQDMFINRAVDQLQSIHLGNSRVIVIGAYGGLAGNLNGETHISTGQSVLVMLSMMTSHILEPADSVDFWNSVNFAFVNNPGLSYIRIYSLDAKNLPRIDTSKWFYRTFEPDREPAVVLVSCGLTAYDTYQAGVCLTENGVPTRVINVVNLKSVNSEDFADLFEDNALVVTVYNGFRRILEYLVSSAIMSNSRIRPRSIESLGFVKGTTGSMDDLKRYYSLDRDGIISFVKEKIQSDLTPEEWTPRQA